MTYTHVIWDWNGTLLDDLARAMDCINGVLTPRGLPPLASVEAYRAVFGFPIIDYYRRAGFTFETEPFEIPAKEYIAKYHSADGIPPALFCDAVPALEAFRAAGLRQVILTASERDNLLAQLLPFGIEGYFDELLGLTDIYAAGKEDIGKAFMARNPGIRAVLIGDTAHDAEVAHAIGADCILVPRGHHGTETLRECGVPLAADLLAAVSVITGQSPASTADE